MQAEANPAHMESQGMTTPARTTEQPLLPHYSDENPLLVYLSLGWGVQSWALAAMIALGYLPPIDIALHSDTGHEARGTYDHARKWTPWLEERGVPVTTLHPENNLVVRHDWGNSSSVQIPAFTLGRQTGSEGTIKRQCTRHWKIIPIRRHLRSLLPPGRPRDGAVIPLQGISLDEWQRMKDSDVRYIVNRYPLVDLRMTRMDCVAWLQQQGLDVPPKSACTFCPFHSRREWQDLKERGGPDWQRAVEIDELVRHQRDLHDLFVHPARKPLEQAVRIPRDDGAEQLEMEIPCDGGACFV